MPQPLQPGHPGQPPQFVRTDGTRFLDGHGQPIRFTGVCVGGWLNMENFITGYAANETLMREKVAAVIGEDRATRFFDRLLTAQASWENLPIVSADPAFDPYGIARLW